MKAIAVGIFASVVIFIPFVTTGCGVSAPSSSAELECSFYIPTGNDARVSLSSAELTALAKRFAIAQLRTNDVDAIGIVDMVAREPIWIEWNLAHLGLGRKISYCFEGKPIMELYFRTNSPVRRDIIYYDASGHKRLVLIDRMDTGMFTDRVFYDNGSGRWEEWRDEAWHPAQKRNDLLITTPSDSLLEELAGIPVVEDPQTVLKSVDLTALGRRFIVLPLLTNNVDGIGISDVRTKKPIWIEWNFERVGQLHEISFCFQGQPVMDLYFKTNGPPARDVCYYDINGRQTVDLADRDGVGTFTHRFVYENGTGRLEVWHDKAWHPVEEQSKKR